MFFKSAKEEDPNSRAARLQERYGELPKNQMSSWYSIFDLFHTAIDISLSELFRSRLDRRTLQPPEAQPTRDLAPRPQPGGQPGCHCHAERPAKYFDYSPPTGQPSSGDLWFDFAADVGDGFNSTYYVAALLAQQTLKPLLADPADPQPKATDSTASSSSSVPDDGLPRGRFLLLGGDEVYPSASREAYEQRFVRVYEAAAYADRPPSPETARHLYALPGNHDWYDGLASFMQVFGDERAIGDYRTRQRSSYFAIKLPHQFWIFAVDIGLWGELDRRQVEYFQDLAEHDLADGDRIILCIAEPDWVKARPNIENLRDGLFYFERRLAEALERAAQRDAALGQPQRPSEDVGREGLSQAPASQAMVSQAPASQATTGAKALHRRDVRVVLRLAGDLHHYRRHESLEPLHPTERNVQQDDFEPTGKRLVQNITAGGGGAFLHPTHDVDSDRRSQLAGALARAADGTVTQFPPGFFKRRDAIAQDQPIDETRQGCLVFQCQKAFPSVEESRRLTRRNLTFGLRNGRFIWSIVGLYGALLTLGLYLFHIEHYIWCALLVALVSLGFVVGCRGYARSEASGEIGESKQGRQYQAYRRRKVRAQAGTNGLLHGIAHALVFGGCLCGMALLYRHWFEPSLDENQNILRQVNGCMPILSDLGEIWDRKPNLPRFTAWYWLLDRSCTADFASVVRFSLSLLFAILGAFVSTAVFGFYLFLALNVSRLKLHANGAFAALRIQDYKNFLRIRVTPDGLTVYPIGIRTVPTKWQLLVPGAPGAVRPPGPTQASLFYPEARKTDAPFYDQLTQTTPGSTPFLIEPPIFIPKADRPNDGLASRSPPTARVHR